jgi:hypothetical protein
MSKERLRFIRVGLCERIGVIVLYSWISIAMLQEFTRHRIDDRQLKNGRMF